MFESLKQRILAMPPEEQARWRAYYSDEEWQRSWSLIGYPFQLPPIGDWTSWTIVGGRGVGKTTAGFRWAVDTFMDGNDVLGIFYHTSSMISLFENLWKTLQESGEYPDLEAMILRSGGRAGLRNISLGNRLMLLGESDALSDRGRGIRDYEYIWADEISDAEQVRRLFPAAKKYVFTQPVRLDPETVVSRAGDPRP